MNRYGTLGVILACLVAMAVLALPGVPEAAAHAVDTPRARDALVMALDHWKQGDTPGSLALLHADDRSGLRLAGRGRSCSITSCWTRARPGTPT